MGKGGVLWVIIHIRLMNQTAPWTGIVKVPYEWSVAGKESLASLRVELGVVCNEVGRRCCDLTALPMFTFMGPLVCLKTNGTNKVTKDT